MTDQSTGHTPSTRGKGSQHDPRRAEAWTRGSSTWPPSADYWV